MSKQPKQSNVNATDEVAVRQAKLVALQAQGDNPYAQNWPQTHVSAQVPGLYQSFEMPAADPATGKVNSAEKEAAEAAANTQEVSVAGRVLFVRLMGKASFIKILDRAGQQQLYLAKDNVGEAAYTQFKKMLDRGDIIGARGTLFKTSTGEVTVKVSAFKILSKALQPLPEKFHGMSDPEQMYRQRHLDLITSEASRTRFKQRSALVHELRNYLHAREFVEVETPILENIAGGAAARPFETYSNALDCPQVLRIATELRLKRLLVGGFERVYEIGRQFRNEGLSRKHNPEFTSIEWYEAYSDFEGTMQRVKHAIQHLAQTVIGTLEIPQADGETVINFGGNWRTVRFATLVEETTAAADWFELPTAEKAALAKSKFGIAVESDWTDHAITEEIFEKHIEPTLIQPTFVTHMPVESCPLAKLNPEDPRFIDVAELCIGGQEIAPIYSEQNDPHEQRRLFEAQVGDETFNLDTDFLETLEYGMPPAGGTGIGIDRLTILLTGASNIRDVILFPALKPLKSEAKGGDAAAKPASKSEPEPAPLAENATELLYLSDTYNLEASAEVLSAAAQEDGTTALVLNQTIFYPQGGGQPFDVGTITAGTTTFNVSNVRLSPSGLVSHFGTFESGAPFEPGTGVTLNVDKARRLQHAKLHSAGHLIDIAVSHLATAHLALNELKPTKGFHDGQGAYVEFEGTLEDAATYIEKLEATCAQFITQGIPITAKQLPAEAAAPYGVAAPQGKQARIVLFEGFENLACGCGGTHLKTTQEIGTLTIRKIKSKKGITRISYAVA